jgi:hypothetical protein
MVEDNVLVLHRPRVQDVQHVVEDPNQLELLAPSLLQSDEQIATS